MKGGGWGWDCARHSFGGCDRPPPDRPTGALTSAQRLAWLAIPSFAAALCSLAITLS